LGSTLGEHRLRITLADFGLLEAPLFPLPTEAMAQDQLSDLDVRKTAIGQSALTVSALQMAQIAAGLADNGVIPPLQLVEATRAPGETWIATPAEGNPHAVVSPRSADAVVVLMREAVRQGSAQAAALLHAQVYGHAGLAIAGPSEMTNAWFIGFVYGPDGRVLAVAVLIEGAAQAADAAYVGGVALEAGLTALGDS
jgi:peptidoglycan glycosyltransferase